MTTGQRIGQYLADHGIKQSFVAQQAGIDYQRFHEIVKGKRKLEAMEYVRVCKVLNKDPDDFMETKEGA